MSDEREIVEAEEAPGIDAAPTPMAVTRKKTEAEINAAEQAETEQIAAYNELSKFLDAPVVKKAFADLGKQYTAEWLNAETPQERENVWARSKALFDVAKELRSVYETGRTAKTTRRRRQAREDARRERKQR